MRRLQVVIDGGPLDQPFAAVTAGEAERLEAALIAIAQLGTEATLSTAIGIARDALGLSASQLDSVLDANGV